MTITKISDLVKPTRQRLKHANDNYTLTDDRAHAMQDAPIQRLCKAGRISNLQMEAGNRFYGDWYNAGLAPLGAIDYERPTVDGKSPKGESDFRVDALQRFNFACRAMTFPILSVVDAVVLAEVSVEKAGQALGYNNAPQARAVATDRLAMGLDILVNHYGLG